MNDHFALNLFISEERIATELQKRLPKSISAGKNKVEILPNWDIKLVEAGLEIRGALNVSHLWKKRMTLFAKARFAILTSLDTFPDVNVDIRNIDFIDPPQIQLFGLIKLPVKKIAQRQLRQRLPEIKETLNFQVKSEIKSQLLKLQEQGQDALPTGLQINFAGMQWKMKQNDRIAELSLLPEMMVKIGQPASHLTFQEPFTNTANQIPIDLQMTMQEMNDLLEKNVGPREIKTPAGIFTLHKITASIFRNQLQFLVDFKEDKNGQLNLRGLLQIIENGQGLSFQVNHMEWQSVGILKQGVFSLFQQKIKNLIEEALEFKAEKIQLLIKTQFINAQDKSLPEPIREIKSVELHPHFNKVEILKNDLHISATLAGQITLQIE